MKKKWMILGVVACMFIGLLAGCSGQGSSSGGKTVEQSSEKNKEQTKQSSEPTKTKEPITLGFVSALTGPAGVIGQSQKEAMELIMDEVNTKGGINGSPIKFIYYDDENNPEKAVQQVKRLIERDGVKIIIGTTGASTTGAVQPTADENKVLVYSLGGTYTPPKNSFVFTSSYKMSSILELLHARYKEQGYKKVGVIAPNDDSGQIMVNIVNKLNTKDGIEYVVERMVGTDIDVTPQLTRLTRNNIDALYVGAFAATAGTVLKNAKQLGMNIPVFSSHANLSRPFANSIKDSIPNQFYLPGAAIMAPDQLSDDNPLKSGLVNFTKNFKAKFNKEPEGVHTSAYDSVNSVLQAIQLVGTDPVNVKNALQTQFKAHPGLQGIFNLTEEDHQGFSNDGAVILQLKQDLSWKLVFEPKFWKK